jgi:hypothetical protein
MAIPAMSARSGLIPVVKSGLAIPIRCCTPRIDPKYLSDERDAVLMLKGAKITRKIMDAPSLRKYRLKEVYTREGMDDAN